MSSIDLRRRGPAAAAPLILLLLCIELTACGGSSSTASTAGTTATPEAASTVTIATSATSGAAEQAKNRAAVALIAKCVRQNGINVPEPEASGNVDLKGIDTNSPRFHKVDEKCIHMLEHLAHGSAAGGGG
jgi:hypothetical protein